MHRLLLCLPLILLAACHSGPPRSVPVSVQSYSQPDWTYAESYFLAPADPDLETHPQFRTFSNYVSAALAPLQLSRVHHPTDADLLIFVAWDHQRTFDQVYIVQPYSGGQSSGPYGGISSGMTSLGAGIAARRAQRDARTISYMITLVAYDVASLTEGQFLTVWETGMIGSAPDTDLHSMFPVILAASAEYIGTTTPGVIEKQIRFTASEAIAIREGPP